MEKWRKDRKREREIDRKKKEQESTEAISGLKIYLLTRHSLTSISNNQTCNTRNTGSWFVLHFFYALVHVAFIIGCILVR